MVIQRVRVKASLSRKPARATPPPQQLPVSRTAQLLALAYQVDEMIRVGEIKNMAEAARVCGVSRARMTQIMNLPLLPPAAQEHLLYAESPNEDCHHRDDIAAVSRPWVRI